MENSHKVKKLEIGLSNTLIDGLEIIIQFSVSYTIYTVGIIWVINTCKKRQSTIVRVESKIKKNY